MPELPSIEPAPTDEEAAAIVAAIEVAWPRAGAPSLEDDESRWRWSGRWWTKPIPLRRDRPWY
jgi:hypothetical protein